MHGDGRGPLRPLGPVPGLPSASTARASVMTAPSMQPPLTEPATSIPGPTIIAAPTLRGDDPHVSTTRARATGLPALSHVRMSSQISRMVYHTSN